MLVSLSVSNFRSIREEITFSLVASNALSGGHAGHAAPIPNSDERVLKTAVIYGANGAGKSNVFRALKYISLTATTPRKKKAPTGREPFKFSASSEQLSSFDIRFIADEHLYRFGFKVDDQYIAEEWLVKEVESREVVLYERATNASGAVTIEAPKLCKVGEKLEALVKVGGPGNQSFLATVFANLQPADVGDDLQRVIRWFSRDLQLVGPDDPLAPIAHYLESDEKLLAFAGEFLRSSSTGVDRLEVDKTELSEAEARARVPEPLLEALLRDIDDEDDSAIVTLPSEEGELLVERKEINRFFTYCVQAVHETPQGEIPLSLSEESDGTRRLLNLIPALNQSSRSAVYFIDEIDRSLHPMLIWKFLEFFLNSCDGQRHQIIVTTHESNLLDLDLLRRDEIWFVEKDRSLATKIYSLADFRVRKDLEIRKHYLQGRFGAVPFLANIDSLMNKEAQQDATCQS